MAAKVKVIDGLIWSGRGNSPWWGVGQNSVDGGKYYIVADLECHDGKIKTRSYKPDGFNLTEREAAIIATELFHLNGRPFPEGHEIDPGLSTGIKFRVTGRMIHCIDRHGHPIMTTRAVSRRPMKTWGVRDAGDNTTMKSGRFAPIEGMPKNGTVPSFTQKLADAERHIKSKVSEEDWFLTKAVMEDVMGEREIHPAVKKFVKSLLEMESA